MTRDGNLQAARTADTEVFYMAGKQLASLSRKLLAAGWPADSPVSVVSCAGWPNQLHTDHTVDALGGAAMLHAGRPTVVTVGAGAGPVAVAVNVDAVEVVEPAADLKPSRATAKP